MSTTPLRERERSLRGDKRQSGSPGRSSSILDNPMSSSSSGEQLRERRPSSSHGDDRRELEREFRDRERRRGKRPERSERPAIRHRRPRRTQSHGDGQEVAWSRSSTTPVKSRGSVLYDNGSRPRRQPQQNGGEQAASNSQHGNGSIGELVAQHKDVNFDAFRHSDRSTVSSSGDKKQQKKRSSNKKSDSSHNNSKTDIDHVISQFREQCDIHMATLLELKNNITTTENQAAVSQEKDKEFAQVRQWYGALAEKHTKLQKEHQALQEEHVKLQERYMNLKRASNFDDSFVLKQTQNLVGDDKPEKSKKKDKKEKKDKSLGDIVWSRAAKVTKAVQNKTHTQLQ